MSLSIAVLVSATVALLLRLAGKLTTSGALAAMLVGAAVLWPTGWPGCAVLGVFASALGTRDSALGARHSALGARHSATGRRGRQVLANGGAAALGALGEFVEPKIGIWLVTIVLAAAGADTWATTFGARSGRPPRDILQGTVVAPGLSGGVTWIGTIGGVMGALMIGGVGGLVSQSGRLFVVAASVGTAGMLFDSVLGSAVQGRFHCPTCDEVSERRMHDCGTVSRRTGGWAWLDNDLVNATTTVAALLAGLALWSMS